MKTIPSVLLFLLFLAPTLSTIRINAGEINAIAEDNREMAWSVMRRAWEAINWEITNLDNVMAMSESLKELEEMPDSVIFEENSIASFLRACLLANLAKADEQYVNNPQFQERLWSEIIDTIATRLMGPETFFLCGRFKQSINRKRYLFGHEYIPNALYGNSSAAITPVTVFNGTNVARFEEKLQPSDYRHGNLDHPPLFYIPNLRYTGSNYKGVESLKLLRVAKNYEAANLPRHAYLAYWEHFYAEGWLIDNSWTNKNMASIFIWERMAINARKCGDNDLARAFLARAAVFGDDECFERSIATLAEWTQNDNVIDENDSEVSADEKRRLLLENVNLYMETRIHPRAWALVEEMPEYFDNPEELIAQIKQSWKEVSDAADNGSRPMYRYGTRINTEEDLYNIVIPWPCSKEAVEKYSKLYRQWFDERMAEEKLKANNAPEISEMP